MSSFLCAVSKKFNNERKEFDVGGSHIWGGKTISGKINGNSNPYNLEDQVSDLRGVRRFIPVM